MRTRQPLAHYPAIVAGQRDQVDSAAEATTVPLGSDESGGPDSFERLLKRVVATSSTPELAAGTLIASRFRVERLIGAGGMGTVYIARDETLGRDVAIKLHHAPGGALRLRREAVAMARLAHPNVVTVFETGELDGRPYVVMEYVAGTTLRAWLAEAPRTVHEIVDMTIGAGEGLAAAHDAGLLHRDIKPENVLIGANGRPRVGDFGLARDVDSKEDPPPDSAARVLSPMTQTGAVLGTPAYMAPEQLSGGPVDARADQFAFCVMLWEALWKERPFAGATVEELAGALKTGKRRTPPPTPKVPARIRAALERGLSADPAERFPTMHALLAELRPRARTARWIAAGGIVAAATAAGSAWLAREERAASVSCTEAGAALVALVPRDLPAKLSAVGATDAAARVGKAVDGFVGTLQASARTACEAGRARREWSAALVTKSDACLQIAARSAQALLAFDRVTAASAPQILRRVSVGLPDLSGCTSPTYLAASPALPQQPAQLEALVAVLSDAAAARGELLQYRADRAQPLLERVERSALRDSPLVKPALLGVRGTLALRRGRADEAETLFSESYYAARAIDDDHTMAPALWNLLRLALEKSPDDASVRAWLQVAMADAQRLAHRAPWLAARLHIATARLAETSGDPQAALASVADARKLVAAGDTIHEDADRIEGAVLLTSGNVDEGVKLYQRSIDSAIARLGPEHPHIGSLAADFAALLLDAEKVNEALHAARQAMTILQKTADPSDQELDTTRVNLAAVLIGLGRRAEAMPYLETARARYVERYGVESTWVANLDMNIAVIIQQDEPRRAAEILARSLATNEKLIGANRIENAQVLFNLAVARRNDGDLRGALEAAQRCEALTSALRPGTDRHPIALAHVAAIANDLGDYKIALAATEKALAMRTPLENPQARAWPLLERARALVATRRGAEARPLLAESRALYHQANLPGRVEQADRLLAKTR